jgi:hypothetical protein
VDAVERLLESSSSAEIGVGECGVSTLHFCVCYSSWPAEAQLAVVGAALTAAPVASLFNRDHLAAVIEVCVCVCACRGALRFTTAYFAGASGAVTRAVDVDGGRNVRSHAGRFFRHQPRTCRSRRCGCNMKLHSRPSTTRAAHAMRRVTAHVRSAAEHEMVSSANAPRRTSGSICSRVICAGAGARERAQQQGQRIRTHAELSLLTDAGLTTS